MNRAADMTNGFEPTRSRTRTVLRGPLCVLMPIACALALVVALIGDAGTVTRTDAAWTDEQFATSTFTAGELGPVQNLQCFDEDSLLDLGLAQNQLEFRWQRPAGVPPSVPLKYEVVWDGGALGESGSAVVETTRYEYETGFSLVDISVDFSIRPRLASWEGAAMRYRTAKIGLLGLSVRVSCTALLGVL